MASTPPAPTMTSSKPASPTGNVPPRPEIVRGGTPGGVLWDAIRSENYILRADEIYLLEQLCLQVNTVAALQKELAEVMETGDFYVTGVAGQPVTNPLFASLEASRRLAAALQRQLKLPDPVEEVAAPAKPTMTTSERAAKAGQARWAKERATNALTALESEG